MVSYRITEPHPSVPTTYFRSGRGGAGNFSQVDPSKLTKGSDATGPASLTKLNTVGSTNASRLYASGRGGAGNLHHSQSERPIFSFDEELDRQRKMMEHQTPVYHVGRGGAGNHSSHDALARSLSNSSDAVSLSSDKSARNSLEGTWNRIRGSFSSKQ